MKDIIKFSRKHDYLICVDSDGCAIDGMTVKHIRCFGPCAIEEWDMQRYQKELLTYWNQINLYTLSRGINRFKGLLLLLQYMKEKAYISDHLEVFENWVNTTAELSNVSLEKEIQLKNDALLIKALSWSHRVNSAVAGLSGGEKKAFTGVQSALRDAYELADIAVISAANAKAVEEEWSENQLLQYVSISMTQEYGSKAECIRKLMEQGGYESDHVIMLGDALGDYQAAKSNHILFYPINAGKEPDSWRTFRDKVLKLFSSDQYTTELMQDYYLAFENNLK